MTDYTEDIEEQRIIAYRATHAPLIRMEAALLDRYEHLYKTLRWLIANNQQATEARRRCDEVMFTIRLALREVYKED
jgi:hypothetical protein